jgi:hypothetical protein
MMSALAQTAVVEAAANAIGDRHMASIEAIRASLDSPIARIDDSFVLVGNKLVECAASLREITPVFEALPQDLEGEEIVEATARLSEVIRQAGEIAQSFDTERAALDALVEKIDAARTPMEELRKIIRMIGIVAINARVVAASIADRNDDFNVFTSDIAELSDSAKKIIGSFFAAYENLSLDAHNASMQRAAFQAKQQDALGQISGRLSGNLENITARRAQSAANTAETSRITHEIAAQVGTTVMAMQVGDSTRQRTEHVGMALDELKNIARNGALPGIDRLSMPNETVVACLVHLQAELLRGVCEDYERDVVEAETCLKALMTDADEIMSQSQTLYGEADRQGASALSTLGADMRDVAVMLEACQADRAKLDATAAKVGRTVNQLLSYVEQVQNIESSMRLVTLNAAIKCAQLGPRGKALDVIAKQLRELTSQTVTFAQAAMTQLDTAAQHAQSVTDSADGEALGRITRLVDGATAAIDLFEQVDGRLSAALRLLDKQCDKVHDLLTEARQRFSGHTAIAELLADAHLRLSALETDLGGPDIEALSHEESGVTLLQLMRKNYTMDSERRIHDGVMGPVPNDAQLSKEESSEIEDDLGLF